MEKIEISKTDTMTAFVLQHETPPPTSLFATGVLTRGWGNGYVGVNSSHPLYGVHYEDLPNNFEHPHGGLTFSNFINDDKSMWYFGFDTCHCFDNEINCDYGYVVSETLTLLDELKKFAV